MPLVPRNHVADRADADGLAARRAAAAPGVVVEAAEQRQRGGARGAELRDEVGQGTRIELRGGDIGVLIESRERCFVAARDPQGAVCHDPLGIRQVPHDFLDAPLAGPGKWSVKEIVGHLADTERIMAYRALRIARGDETPLPGFDENAYVPPAKFDARPLSDLVAELRTTRAATLALFRSFDDDAWRRRGTASGKPVSVRAIGYMIPG